MRKVKAIVEAERQIYIPNFKSLKSKLLAIYQLDESYQIFRYMKELRLVEYYTGKNILLTLYHGRKMAKYGNQLGYYISPGCLQRGVIIYHRGSIIINYRSVIGEGCRFHGDNCVGNNGKNEGCPVLGKNVDVGIGAKIIGNVIIADDICIGANAVVTKSFLEPGITIAGVPAKKINTKQ